MRDQVTHRHPSRRLRRDEAGNMVIAVTVIMVLALLSAAVVARTTAGIKQTRQGQDFTAALANADAGVSDALFRIDQLGGAVATSFCVGNNAACTVHSVPGASSVSYTARRVDDNTYTVLSKGLVNGQYHGVQATVVRSFSYPYAIFAKTTLTFNGNTGNYPNSGINTVDSTGAIVNSPPPDVATNGQVVCHGSSSPAHNQDYYKGGGTNCDNGYLKAGIYDPKDPQQCPVTPNNPPTPCFPASALPCPAVGGTFPLTIAPGVYHCTEANAVGGTLTFPDGFNVPAGTDPVQLFIVPTVNTINLNVSIANANVNLNGDPTRLRVYLSGAGSILEGNGAHGGDFTGIMYAPSADATSNGCKANWRGAIVVNTFTCNGGPNVQINYDNRIQTLRSTFWQVTNYTEIPSTAVTLP